MHANADHRCVFKVALIFGHAVQLRPVCQLTLPDSFETKSLIKKVK